MIGSAQHNPSAREIAYPRDRQFVMRLLIIEDDRDAADYLVKAFREVGHVAELAVDGEEGLAHALDGQYDVLIVDRMLPKLDGLAVIGTLRGKGIETPALILSALGQVDDRVRGLRAGGDDYLPKPYSFSELLARTGLDAEELPAQMDAGGWDALRTRFTDLFKTKTRAEWDELLLGTDACYAPVLTMSEATNDAHIQARSTIIERDGVPQPAPAPRFSRTAGEVQRSAPWPGQQTDEALDDWGFGADEIAKLRATNAIA